MSKAKEATAPKPTATAAPQLVKGERSDVLDIVRNMGQKAFEVEGSKEEKDAQKVKLFRAAAATAGKEYSQADGTLIQYIMAASSELGWTKKRNTGGSGSTKSDGSISGDDLKKAKNTAKEMGLTPAELLDQIRKLKTYVTDLDKLEASLEYLEELMRD
jgi:hypothetical protein